MSVQALDWAFAQPVKSSARFVLVVLADHADQAHSCWPSVGRISARTGFGASTVRRALTDLEEAGLIRIEHRARPNGSRTSSRYYLAALNPQIDPATVDDPPSQIGRAPLPEREGPPPRAGGAIEPSLEPSSKDPHAEAFGAWWEIYPRKVSKQAAAKAWKARTKAKDLPDDLVEITQRFAASVADKDPEFIPHPATWLNQHRWEDVPTSAPRGQDEGPSEAYRAWLETPQGKAHLARKEAQ